VPNVVKRINNALQRADGAAPCRRQRLDRLVQAIIADAEAGFGGVPQRLELMKQMIEAGAAGVHFEDQLSSAKKCGHMGGKVLVPTQEGVNKLVAARLAADLCDVTHVLIAPHRCESATLITSDVDERDRRSSNQASAPWRVSSMCDRALDAAVARVLRTHVCGSFMV